MKYAQTAASIANAQRIESCGNAKGGSNKLFGFYSTKRDRLNTSIVTVKAAGQVAPHLVVSNLITTRTGTVTRDKSRWIWDKKRQCWK